MELTLEEYKKKFTDFKDDAYSHQNNKIGDFITDLLESDVSKIGRASCRERV